ncbi:MULTISPECIES: hypothetical protein, partial [unclassified Granulicatella]|uniref:hypothetical protein n=1 Tax=unclassified Granulicatella TaxID=2630493 RepID=UPI0010736D07
MKTIEVELYVSWGDRDCSIFIPEKIDFIWEEDIRRLLLNTYPNCQMEEINNMFIEFISDYFLSGLNDNEIGMSIIEQGEKVKYSAS